MTQTDAEIVEAAEDGISDRAWIRTLGAFVGPYLPALASVREPAESVETNLTEVDPRVRYALHDALIAACERIARICRADVEPAPEVPELDALAQRIDRCQKTD